MLLVSLNLSSEYVRPTKVLGTAHKVVSFHVQSPAPCKGTMHIIHPQVPSGDAYCATQKCNATVETADLKYETHVLLNFGAAIVRGRQRGPSINKQFKFWRRHLESQAARPG